MRTASLLQDGETKAILHAVYLNNVDKEEFHTQEYFFVAIHIINEQHTSDDEGLNNPDYSLTMLEDVNIGNYTSIEARALSITKLNEDSRISQNMPIKSKWSYFYLVKFSELNQENLTLFFKSTKYGKAKLTFHKGGSFKVGKSLFKTVKRPASN